MNSTNSLSQWKAAINEQVRIARTQLRAPEPLSLADWADQNFYLSPESSYVEMPWSTLSFQRGIMNVISNDDTREIWIIKSARVGYTKMLLATAGYFAEHKKRSGAIWQPTDDDRDEFVKEEVETAIRDCPAWRNVFPTFELKSKHNTLKLKRFLGSSLHLRGGKAAKNYRRLTLSWAALDELDAYDDLIEREAPPHQLANRRISRANFPKLICGSTPLVKGTSMIEAGEEKCEARFRWHIRCPHCDHEQIVRWGGKDQVGGIKWEDAERKVDAAATAAYQCEFCEKTFDHNQYQKQAQETGRWLTEDGSLWIDHDGNFRDEEGTRADAPLSVGFHVWSGINEMVPWSDIVHEWLKAKEDRKELQGFVNMTLGEAWEEDAVEQMDHQKMHHNRREHYDWEVPEYVNAITFGVDHQDDRFEFGFCGWGAGEELWHLTYDTLQGDLARPEIWAKLEQALRREFRKQDGTIMRPVIGCIDHGGHYSKEVEALSKRMGRLFVIPTKGRSTYGHPIVDMPKKPNKNGVYLAMVGTDTVKNRLYQQLLIEIPEEHEPGEPISGYVHWPKTSDFTEEYFKQFTAEKRIPKWTGGKKRYVWDAEKRRNEPWDVTLLNLVAIHIAQQRFGLSLDEPTQGSEPKETKKRSLSEMAREMNDG